MPTELERRYAARLKESGLTAQNAEKLGLILLNAEQVRDLEPHYEARGGIVIPYHDIHGTRHPTMYRLRYLEDPPTGFGGPSERRYTQPADLGPMAYLPPLVDWAQVRERSEDRVLVITEGELKAAAATKLGFPTIGLGGVSSWRSARQGIGLLPELEAWPWEGWQVYVCYDTEVTAKPQVQQELVLLSRALLERGARPYAVLLPEVRGLGKTGLDDFLVAKGRGAHAALSALLAQAQEFSESEALWALNEEVALIEDPGHVINLETGQSMTAYAFMNVLYADRSYTYTDHSNPERPKLKTAKTAKRWVEWPFRLKLRRIAYRPAQPRVTSEGEYNLWRSWGVLPAPGDIAPWRQLLKVLFGEDRKKIRWFEQWLAYPLQHPGEKMFTGVLIWGAAQGTGKTLVGETMGRIYGANYQQIGPSQLSENFNEWAEMKQFVMGDEIAGGDKRIDGDRLKRIITSKKIRINKKHIPAYTIDDTINYYFSSNHADPFYLEHGDRRFFVHEVRCEQPPERSFYADTYLPWLEGAGAAALFYHLMRVDLTGFDPGGPAPFTPDKEEMIAHGASDIDRWCRELKLNPDELLRNRVEYPSDLWTAEELLQVYDPAGGGKVKVARVGVGLSQAQFPRALGKDQARPYVMTCQGLKKLWVVKNAKEWEPGKRSVTEIRDHFNRHRDKITKVKLRGATLA